MTELRLFVAAILLLPVALSCNTPSGRFHSDAFKLGACLVPEDVVVGLELPDDLRLREGETVHQQGFSLDADGDFTLTRRKATEVGYLGVEVCSGTEDDAASVKDSPPSGVLVQSVQKNGPAAVAGVLPGDIIVTFEGKRLRSPDQFEHLVRKSRPGKEVMIEHGRDGKAAPATLTVGKAPHVGRKHSYHDRLDTLDDLDRTGLKLLEVPPNFRPIILGDHEAVPGLLVVGILDGGPAFWSDLRLGQELVAVDGVTVGTLGKYCEVLVRFTVGEIVSFEARQGDVVVQTSLELVDSAPTPHGFDVVGLLKYSREPKTTRFGLGWNFVYWQESFRAIVKRGEEYRHYTSVDWGMAFDLLRYTSTPKESMLRIGWFWPITSCG